MPPRRMAPAPWTTTRATILLALVIVYSVLIIIPIRVNGLDNSDAGGVLFSIFAFLPTPIVLYLLWTRIVTPIFDDDLNNDANATPVIYILSYLSLSVSMSLIYLFFWLQDRDTFENIALVDNAYSAWFMMLYGSVLIGFGTAPAHTIPTKSIVSVVASLHTIIGWASTVIMVAEMLVIYTDFRKRQKNLSAKKTDSGAAQPLAISIGQKAFMPDNYGRASPFPGGNNSAGGFNPRFQPQFLPPPPMNN